MKLANNIVCLVVWDQYWRNTFIEWSNNASMSENGLHISSTFTTSCGMIHNWYDTFISSSVERESYISEICTLKTSLHPRTFLYKWECSWYISPWHSCYVLWSKITNLNIYWFSISKNVLIEKLSANKRMKTGAKCCHRGFGYWLTRTIHNSWISRTYWELFMDEEFSLGTNSQSSCIRIGISTSIEGKHFISRVHTECSRYDEIMTLSYSFIDRTNFFSHPWSTRYGNSVRDTSIDKCRNIFSEFDKRHDCMEFPSTPTTTIMYWFFPDWCNIIIHFFWSSSKKTCCGRPLSCIEIHIGGILLKKLLNISLYFCKNSIPVKGEANSIKNKILYREQELFGFLHISNSQRRSGFYEDIGCTKLICIWSRENDRKWSIFSETLNQWSCVGDTSCLYTSDFEYSWK